MKITYWTTACLEPRIEAVSKEVYELAAHFAGSRIVGVSPHLFFKLSWRRRIVGFHPRWDPLLRLAIPVLEQRTDVNHVYAEVSPWLFFKALKRKPTLLTIASEKGEPVPEFMHRCDAIVVQTVEMKERLEAADVDDGKIRLIYPGLDLARYVPRDGVRACRRPQILFATFPRTEEELAARGVIFLIEIARKLPEIRFSLLSRPWRGGASGLPAVKHMLERHEVKNVHVLEGMQEDMMELYRRHDFTIVPYTRRDGGKECPRSLVETLACGVPVLISDVAPFASFVAEHDCGRVFSLNADSFASALNAGLSAYPRISTNAVSCAHVYFDRENTFREYAGIYGRLMSIGRKRAR